jgi:hypothetical protein
MESSFVAAKAALAAAVPLAHPDNKAAISLATDASAKHVGSVLQQRQQGAWCPLSFFSKKLSSSEMKYSAFDREPLAVYSAVKHFRFILEGLQFAVFMDYKPITAALHRRTLPLSARVQRQLSFIAEFIADVRYIPGLVNVVADTLSRLSPSPSIPAAVVAPPSHPAAAGTFSPLPITSPHLPQLVASLPAAVPPHLSPLPPPGVCSQTMAEQQVLCPEVARLQMSSSLKVSSAPAGNVLLFGDTSTGIFCPLVPVPMRFAVFSALHSVGHPGMRATRRLISSRFV